MVQKGMRGRGSPFLHGSDRVSCSPGDLGKCLLPCKFVCTVTSFFLPKWEHHCAQTLPHLAAVHHVPEKLPSVTALRDSFMIVTERPVCVRPSLAVRTAAELVGCGPCLHIAGTKSANTWL